MSKPKSDWHTLSGIPAQTDKIVLTDEADGISFDFPQHNNKFIDPKHAIDYLTTNQETSLTGATAISMTFETTGTGTVVFDGHTEASNTGTAPPNVRLFFESDTGNHANQPYGRWWSDQPVTLQPDGTFTVTTNLDPSHWSSVFGEFGNASAVALAGFNDAMAHVKGEGMTFGFGNASGHGVGVDIGGADTFTLHDYSVIFPTHTDHLLLV